APFDIDQTGMGIKMRPLVTRLVPKDALNTWMGGNRGQNFPHEFALGTSADALILGGRVRQWINRLRVRTPGTGDGNTNKQRDSQHSPLVQEIGNLEEISEKRCPPLSAKVHFQTNSAHTDPPPHQ